MKLTLSAFYVLIAASLAAFLLHVPTRRREKSLALLERGGGGRAAGARRITGTLALAVAGKRRPHILLAFSCLAVLVLFRSMLLASLVWPAGMLARRLVSGRVLGKVKARKEEQVTEFIDSLSQSLRAGLSLRQALEISLEDVGPELGEDVRGILKDMRMGSGLEEAMAGAAAGSSSSSLRLTFSVIGLMHGKGGDLPRILDRLRVRVSGGLEARREARILTSQSRASGYLVSSLPAVFLLLQAALSPRSLRPLFTTPTGNVIIAVALALNAAAFLIIRKMVDQEV